jgi:ABC-type arginine transport system ATPase subunit
MLTNVPGDPEDGTTVPATKKSKGPGGRPLMFEVQIVIFKGPYVTFNPGIRGTIVTFIRT